ncbi:UNVERIFIED_CONTAM: hypothetical protein FKN15_038553 [Acipenser sinensis]
MQEAAGRGRQSCEVGLPVMAVTRRDGVHSVTAQCTLQVTIITDEMLSSSITLRLAHMSQERFLSPLLRLFLEGMATVLSASKEDVIVFNIQNDTDVSASILNVSLSVLLPGGGGQFFSSEDLQERIYLNRSLLASISTQRVLPFDDNICLREPCENYMKCVSVLKFDSLAPFITSDTILFRPIHPINGLRCRCPTGFTGDYCETEVNLCYWNPCRNGGLCRSREGGFTCECPEEFTEQSPGAREVIIRERNEFPARTLCERVLERHTVFATKERNGLLLYNGRFNEKHDFIALEIINEQIQLTFSAGESTTRVSPYIPGGVSDGQWHVVQLQYYNKTGAPAVSALQDSACGLEAVKTGAPAVSALQDSACGLEAVKTGAPAVSALQDSACGLEAVKTGAPAVSALQDSACGLEAVKTGAPAVSALQDSACGLEAVKTGAPAVSALQDSACGLEAVKTGAPAVSALQDSACGLEAVKTGAPAVSALQDSACGLEAVKTGPPAVSALQDSACGLEAVKTGAPAVSALQAVWFWKRCWALTPPRCTGH